MYLKCHVLCMTYIYMYTGISQCLQEGRWVNEEPYEVQGVNVGDSAILSEAPRKGRQNRIQQVQSQCTVDLFIHS